MPAFKDLCIVEFRRSSVKLKMVHHQRFIISVFVTSVRRTSFVVWNLKLDAELVAYSWKDSIRQTVSAGKIKETITRDHMKVKITVAGHDFEAILNNSEAARDFASLFPLSLNLSDYARTEKVSDLSRRLSTKGSQSGCSAEIGDITYYSPWGNLAIFYRSFGYAAGLIKLGRIEGDMKLFQTGCEQSEATFELVD